MADDPDHIRFTKEAHAQWLTIAFSLEKWQIRDLGLGKFFAFCSQTGATSPGYKWLLQSNTIDDVNIVSAEGSCISGEYGQATLQIGDQEQDVGLLSVGPWAIVFVPTDDNLDEWLNKNHGGPATLMNAVILRIICLANDV